MISQRKTHSRLAQAMLLIACVILGTILTNHAFNHLGLGGIKIGMPSAEEEGSAPKLQDTLTDGRIISSYLLLTPGTSILSRDAYPLNCSEDDACVILDPGYQWWRSEDMFEVRPIVLAISSSGAQLNRIRWSEQECAAIAHRSTIKTGWLSEPEPATFVGISGEGGCILRLP